MEHIRTRKDELLPLKYKGMYVSICPSHEYILPVCLAFGYQRLFHKIDFGFQS